MPFVPNYPDREPSRGEVDALSGPVLIEFGAPWCGHCQRTQPLLEAALALQPGLRHIKVEDGPGRPLGRSFRVKLWPTLVLLQDGVELARVVRPDRQEPIDALLARPGANPS